MYSNLKLGDCSVGTPLQVVDVPGCPREGASLAVVGPGWISGRQEAKEQLDGVISPANHAGEHHRLALRAAGPPRQSAVLLFFIDDRLLIGRTIYL